MFLAHLTRECVTDFLNEETTEPCCRALTRQIIPCTVQQLQQPAAAGCNLREAL
jgi:hypothetical protein